LTAQNLKISSRSVVDLSCREIDVLDAGSVADEQVVSAEVQYALPFRKPSIEHHLAGVDDLAGVV